MESETKQQFASPETNPTPVLSPGRKRLRVIAILIAIILIIVGGLGVFFVLITGDKNLLPIIAPNIELPPVHESQRKTSLVTFIRGGDVWLGSIDGSNFKQITFHSDISYSWQHVSSEISRVHDVTNYYAKYPRLSYDGKYLAYIAMTQDSIENMNERELRIAAESDEVKSRGESEIFNAPEINYEIHIYNIPEQAEIPITRVQSSPEDLVGKFQSLKWALVRNKLYYIKDSHLHMIGEDSEDSIDNFIHSIIAENLCGFDCINQPDDRDLFSLNNDGSKIAASYLTGKPCETFLEFKLMVLDAGNKLISKQPSDLSWCSVIVGPWVGNEFITVEYIDGVEFFKYGSDSWENKEKLFEDQNYQFKGPITLSPNNMYISYPIGNYTYSFSGEINMRIRNLHTQDYFDVLTYIQGDEKFAGNRIFNAKWDSDSENLYFILADEEGDTSSLVKFDVDKKEPVLFMADAEDSDIN